MMQLLSRYPVLTSPFALAFVAAVAALAASVLLGVQDVSAGPIIQRGPRH